MVHRKDRQQDRADHDRRGITEYAVPTSGAYPDGITAGPDGALWFTEYQRQQDRADHDRRDRSPNTPFPPATPGPDGIAAGPDGALWFTE